jgi:hypothetical protein
MKQTPSISPYSSPNKNISMINKEYSNNLTACSENNMDIANAHKSKTNVTITRIGTMVDMTKFPASASSTAIPSFPPSSIAPDLNPFIARFLSSSSTY